MVVEVSISNNDDITVNSVASKRSQKSVGDSKATKAAEVKVGDHIFQRWYAFTKGIVSFGILEVCLKPVTESPRPFSLPSTQTEGGERFRFQGS